MHQMRTPSAAAQAAQAAAARVTGLTRKNRTDTGEHFARIDCPVLSGGGPQQVTGRSLVTSPIAAK